MMNLIEITGIPGAGKSFVLKRDFPTNKYTYLDDKFCDKSLRIKNLYTFLRTPLRELALLLIGLFVLGLRPLYTILWHVFMTDWSLFRKVNVIRNIVKRFAILKLASKCPSEHYVIDEGLYHLNFVFSGSNTDNFVQYLDTSQFGCPYVIVVDAPEEVIISRLKVRGHGRLRGNVDEENIRTFVKQSCNIRDVLIDHLEDNAIQYTTFKND